MPNLVRYAPAIVKSRPSRWLDGLRSFWQSLPSLKDPALVKYWGGGARTAAGIQVTQENAFTFSAVFDAVDQISSDVGKLPLNLRKRRADGGSDPYFESKVYRLLKNEPNPEMGSMVFRRTLTAHALTWPGGYAEIERDGLDRPAAIWPLSPDRVKAEREKTGKKRLYYRYRNDTGADTLLEPKDVIHINGLGFDPHCGYSRIHMARQAIGLALAAETFGASFFANGATFGGVLSAVGINTEEEAIELEKKIKNRHQGVERAHEFLVTWGDMKFLPTGVAPQNAQMNELRSKQVEEVARFFNMPVHKLKNLDRATNNNIESQDLEYYKGCLLNWITLWEEEGNRKLISPLESRQQFIKHNANAFLRGDTASRTALYTALLDRGVYNADQVLELEDMNPQPGGIGKIYLVQGAMFDKSQLVARDAAAIKKAEAPPPVPAPPANPTPDPNAERMLQELTARADRAEQAAADARAQVETEREARIAAEATVSTSKEEREAARVREQAAIELAARADLVATEAQRDVSVVREQIAAAHSAQAAAEILASTERTARSEADGRAQAAGAQATAAEQAASEARACVVTIQAQLDRWTASAAAADARASAAESHITAATTARQAAEAAIGEWQERLNEARANLNAAEEKRLAAEALVTLTQADRIAAESLRDAALADVEQIRLRLTADVAGVQQQLTETRTQAEAAEAKRLEAAACAVKDTIDRAAAEAARDEARASADQARAELAAALTAKVRAEAGLAATAAAEQAAVEACATAIAEAETVRTAAATLTLERDEALRIAGQAHADLTASLTAKAQLEADLTVAERATADTRAQASQDAETLRAAAAAVTAERDEALRAADTVRVQLVTAESQQSEIETRVSALQTARTEAETALVAAKRAEEESTAAVISAHRSLVVHIMRDLLQNEIDRVAKNQRSCEKLKAWMDSWYDADLMADDLVPAVTLHLVSIRSSESPVDVARQIAVDHIADSKRQIQSVIDDGANDLGRNVARLIRRWETERVFILADKLMQKELDYARRRSA